MGDGVRVTLVTPRWRRDRSRRSASRFAGVSFPEMFGPERLDNVLEDRWPRGQLAAELIAQVAARAPVDQRERESVERILVELDHLLDPFDEHASAVHLTASGIVISERGVLLLKHRRLGIWVQPGGHIDSGEAPWEAAVREVREETGLEVALNSGPLASVAFSEIYALDHVDVHPGPRGHTHLDLRYLMRAGVNGESTDPCPPPEESQEVEWLDWAEAIGRADPGLRGALIALRP
jgi:8-oxo-dGTP pyrophosphatase MutT (NUDIX family)